MKINQHVTGVNAAIKYQMSNTYVSAGRTSQLVIRIEGKISRESEISVTRQ